jgi:hypothetical protein
MFRTGLIACSMRAGGLVPYPALMAAGDDPKHPGPRALPPLARCTTVPPDVVAMLLGLGQACNDVGLAVLSAQAQFGYADEALWRNEQTDPGDPLLTWFVDQRHSACLDHLERLTSLYARAATQYAIFAVETASRVANRQTPQATGWRPALPSDVLTMAQIHVPLFQIPDSAVSADSRDQLDLENAALASSHRVLLAAMADVESPSTTFDEPAQVVQREKAYVLEMDFPAALHDYANICAFALTIM